MSRQALILVLVVIALIMFVPVLLADGVERFFEGIGTMFDRWSTE